MSYFPSDDPQDSRYMLRPRGDARPYRPDAPPDFAQPAWPEVAPPAQPSAPRPLNTPGYHPIPDATSSGWGGVLVLCSLVLGIAMAWGAYERNMRLVTVRQYDVERVHSDILAAHDRDLGQLMADPQTALVKLTPTGASQVKAATLAWNNRQERGALFCDGLEPLAEGLKYQVWADPPGGSPTRLGVFLPQPGTDIFALNAAVSLEPNTPLRVVAGRSESTKSGEVSGTALRTVFTGHI